MTETAFDLLERDHRAIRGLFDRVSSPEEDRAAALRELVQRLAAHVAVEQAIVLPELRQCGGGDVGLGRRLRREYHVISHKLALIQRRKANSPDQPDLVAETGDAFAAHVERCQQALYPDLRRCLDPVRLERLAERLRAADDVVVNRPHPHLLSLGPVSRLMTRVAGGLDRVRIFGEWGGLFSTANDNSPARGRAHLEQGSPTTPPPWDRRAEGR